MTDDLTILASAYLDGQATAAERAQVDDDAALLAEVERLRRVRSVLGDTSDDGNTAPISTRERHLAAALDAWDRLPTSELGSDPTPTGTDQAGAAGGASITAPIPLRDQRAKRRPVSTRFLTAAAAVVVLAGAGVVVSGALDNSGTDESADFSTALSDAGDADRSADVLAAEEFVTEGEGSAADEIAEEAAPAAAVEAVAAEAGGPDQQPPDESVDVLSNNADLAEFANRLIIARTNQNNATISANSAGDSQDDAVASDSDAAGQPPAQTTPPTLAPPVDLCDLIDDFVGYAYWQASGLFDDPIAVGIDNSTNEAVAYQADTCTTVARTPLP